MVQWLGLGAFSAKGMGSILGWEAKIPQATQRGQKKNFFLIFQNRETKKKFRKKVYSYLSS